MQSGADFPLADILKGVSFSFGLQRPSESHHRHTNGVQIALLEEIHALEGFLNTDALLFAPLHEGVDVLHAREIGNRLLDLLDGVGLDAIRELAQQSPIL